MVARQKGSEARRLTNSIRRLKASEGRDLLADDGALRAGNLEWLEPGANQLTRRVRRAHQSAILMAAALEQVVTQLVRGHSANNSTPTSAFPTFLACTQI